MVGKKELSTILVEDTEVDVARPAPPEAFYTLSANCSTLQVIILHSFMMLRVITGASMTGTCSFVSHGPSLKFQTITLMWPRFFLLPSSVVLLLLCWSCVSFSPLFKNVGSCWTCVTSLFLERGFVAS